jgi:4-hydroxybenzoate polyprenyltransferase
VVRSEQWWDPKVAPLVGLSALAIGSAPGPAPSGALADLLLLLVSMVGVAAFGHLVNDWCDREADAAAGKANLLVGLAAPRRAALVAASLLLGLGPWVALPDRPAARAALAVEVALLIAYSVPPLRLKGRAWAGALADAGYAFAVPFAIVALALAPSPATEGGPLLVVLLVAFGLLAGLRGILFHQIDDLEADRAAGVGTVARAVGVDRLERLLARVLLPLEVVLLVALVVLSGVAWLWGLAVAFLAWRTFQISFLWSEPVVASTLRQDRQRVQVVGFSYINEFIERWVPLAAVVAVAWSTGGWWWAAVVAHLLAFRTAVRTFFAWDLWVLPDAVERLAHVRRGRRAVRRVAQRRLASLAAGPVPLADPTARRWVFVVCGPPSHLETLETALRHLRPLTQAEIWVVTDASRNAQPIAHPAIDRVVDVATPPELDDHQASIWLKTSVHRHVPAGEWCYLDSDIIAIAPGAEEVFDHRVGPVAFASDVTIRENSVDRFSPWAMTCACLGLDDEHSCSHLREQLRARFGLEVDGSWMHWNGGVFAFGPDGADFLDLWHERAVASFDWPEWKTRDQGALISTVWTLGLQDLPRLPPTFNFIADLGNSDLCLDPERGWAHHPSGPWYQAKMLHLYTSPLEDPTWDLGRDVEAVVIRRSMVRIHRYERRELRDRSVDRVHQVWWRAEFHLERLAYKARTMPRRLKPSRVARSVLRRLGRDPGAPHLADPLDAEPQRVEQRR